MVSPRGGLTVHWGLSWSHHQDVTCAEQEGCPESLRRLGGKVHFWPADDAEKVEVAAGTPQGGGRNSPWGTGSQRGARGPWHGARWVVCRVLAQEPLHWLQRGMQL